MEYFWTSTEEALLRAWYSERDGKSLDLDRLAAALGRTYAATALKASKLGLGQQTRISVAKIDGRYPSRQPKFTNAKERNEATGQRIKTYIAEHGHPRGATGITQTTEQREATSARLKAYNASLTPMDKEVNRLKSNATKIARYGSAGPAVRGEAMYSRARGGKRADLGNQYFRSRWEANYARYLNFLVETKTIQSWAYEPTTFHFDGVTRGVISYTPDFLVTELNGSTSWHEVKGWMDDKSKAKLRRMAQFYPDEKVIVIGPNEYRSLSKSAGLIRGWE